MCSGSAKNPPSSVARESKDAKVVGASYTAAYEGPIPPAREMIGYQQADANLPNRIMTVYENEQKHTIEMDKIAIRDRRYQQWLSWLFMFSLLIFSFILALKGKTIAAFVVGGIPTVPVLVLIFKNLFTGKSELDNISAR